MSSQYPVNDTVKEVDFFTGFWSEDPEMKPGLDVSINSNPSVSVYPMSISRPAWITFDIYT